MAFVQVSELSNWTTSLGQVPKQNKHRRLIFLLFTTQASWLNSILKGGMAGRVKMLWNPEQDERAGGWWLIVDPGEILQSAPTLQTDQTSKLKRKRSCLDCQEDCHWHSGPQFSILVLSAALQLPRCITGMKPILSLIDRSTLSLAPQGALYMPWCSAKDPAQLFKVFTQPNASVTILAPNHYYMINAI